MDVIKLIEGDKEATSTCTENIFYPQHLSGLLKRSHVSFSYNQETVLRNSFTRAVVVLNKKDRFEIMIIVIK